MSVDQAGPVRPDEQIDLQRLAVYLEQQFPEIAGALSIAQFPRGHSNLTYLLCNGDREYVLRRPPFGNPVRSAHDMGREFRVLSKLCDVYEPAPRPLLHCTDLTVIGDEFYLMERRTGLVLRGDNTPAVLESQPDLVRRLCEAFIENLARLHALDYRAAGLAELGRPEGYIERQVRGWNQRYEQAKTDEHPDVQRLGRWLTDHRPADGRPALIHNDYKYDNLVLDADEPTRIVAVLDWEMSTVGDPLMDLGTALSYWVEPDDSDEQLKSAFGPTMIAGSMTRQELADRYAEQSGISVNGILFYYCFGLFKLAVIVQQIYARYVRGQTRDPRFADLNQRVAVLARTALRAITAGRM